jgi:hypothetical protein
MAALNIRDVDVTSLERFKARAKVEGLTLRAWVLAVLQVALMDDGGSVASVPAPAVGSARKKEARQPAQATQPEPQTTATAARLEPAPNGGREAHDPKTCRVYRCGACIDAKHHDPHRSV